MLGLDRQCGSRKSSAGGGCPRCHPPPRGLPPGRALPDAACRLPSNGRHVCGGWGHGVYCLEMKVQVVSKRCGSEGCPGPAAEDPCVCARVDRLVLWQARPQGAWFLSSGPPRLASRFLSTCCCGAAHCPPGCSLPSGQGPAPHWCCYASAEIGTPRGTGHTGLPTLWVWGDPPGPCPGLQRRVGPGCHSHGAPSFLGPGDTLAPPAPLKKTSAVVTDVLFRLRWCVWAGL